MLTKMAIVLVAGLANVSGVSADEKPAVGPASPAVECRADIHWDRNEKDWPGYLISASGKEQCVPFTATALFPPAGYQGDFYVDEFTDAKIREAWAACEAQGATCSKPPLDFATMFGGKNEFRATGTIDAVGKIDANGTVDLAAIRRPAYFGSAPYAEAIAEADSRTFVVEVRVPAETAETKHLGVAEGTMWGQRGWFIQGAGVDDGKGGSVHALVILSGGRSVETTAIQHPDDVVYAHNTETGKYDAVKFPNATTEKWGVRQWRDYIYKLNVAGFDVLTLDKRGHGVSGGVEVTNTVQQARDLFRALDAFETGKGLRIMGADGKLHEGESAGGILLRGVKAKEAPVIVGGPSQGSMVASHAMHFNFVADCDFDATESTCRAPLGYNLKGAIMLAEFAKGMGYRPSPLPEAALRARFNVAFVPSGEVLSGISKWPAVFFGRGLWDFAGSLEGTLDAYNRVTGPKEIVVVRGPHSENEYGPENVAHMQERVVAFAEAVVRGDNNVPGAAKFSNLKELVATAPASWEASMDPAGPKQ
jgi:hypothetical protein